MKHRYYVTNAFNDCISDEIKDCYEDSFTVGEFETDEEAMKATEEIQYKHDAEAYKIVDALDADGACYAAHLWCAPNEEDDWTDYQIVMQDNEHSAMHLYEVKNAVYYSDTFGRGYHDFDDDLLKCYKDNFVLGFFESDREAIKVLEDIQYEHDKAASALLTKIQKERGYAVTRYGELGEGGVCYEANLWKKVGDEYVRVGEDE